MSTSAERLRALQAATSRQVRSFHRPHDAHGRPQRISSFFGARVFSADRMRERLPPEIFNRWHDTVERGAHLERPVADAIAQAVKEWALEQGVTHFCHWFHPMTGATAEKHDSFLAFDKDGRPIEKFSGSMLIQSEPDASSFPSGGRRSTFEARGYTAWDPTSPMFIMESVNGRFLCIPSAFVGYHGEALDEKAPLLRSMESLSHAAVRLLGLLGHPGVPRVTATVGPEQEYFLVDRAWAGLRPDLVIAGRSLTGARAPKGQSLEDHYFGSIPPRVLAFMEEVEHELYQLGVSAKTRHNEVAPMQFEIAPIFAEANLAADHNQLVMQTLRKVAARHDFAVLLHEKPFAGVNGSGKHVNWSVATATENLLEPGTNPQDNLRFLAFLGAVLLGVKRHAAVLRASIASHGNDFRLGANEAPPAIISVFLGDFLTRICDAIASGTVANLPTGQAMLELGVSRMPAIAKDNTDRNRTSPFAFTGNKFEFRAVGSSASISFPTTCLNVAVTDALVQMCAWIEAEGGGPEAAMKALRRAMEESAPVRFDGNGYAAEWVVEAERRGLPHARNTPAALRALHTEEAKALFERHTVLTREELHSRYDVRVEQYNKKVEIEADVLRSMVDTMILPAALADLAAAARASRDLFDATGAYSTAARERHHRLSVLVDALNDARKALGEALEAPVEGGEIERADANQARVVPALLEVRQAADRLEDAVSDSAWPLPRYREMLFLG